MFLLVTFQTYESSFPKLANGTKTERESAVNTEELLGFGSGKLGLNVSRMQSATAESIGEEREK